MDAGAAGVIVPMVDSAVDAAAVAACCYPPLGSRSFGPVRAALGRPEWSTDLANEQILCVVMIETRGGLANLAEILSVPGVDAILVGAIDLSLTHGVLGDDQSRWRLVEQVFDKCREYAVPSGMAVSSAADAKSGVEGGATLVALSPDAWLLSGAVEDYLRYCGVTH